MDSNNKSQSVDTSCKTGVLKASSVRLTTPAHTRHIQTHSYVREAKVVFSWLVVTATTSTKDMESRVQDVLWSTSRCCLNMKVTRTDNHTSHKSPATSRKDAGTKAAGSPMRISSRRTVSWRATSTQTKKYKKQKKKS